MSFQVRIVALPSAFSRSHFQSGQTALDQYFKKQVSQDIRRRTTTCFIALGPQDELLGYYTLAAASINLSGLPSLYANKLPRYPSVPTVRLGRLAVDQRYQGQGWGGVLLVDAIQRATNVEIGAYAMIVDAKDQVAANFYAYHGFVGLQDMPLSLFLPLKGV